MKDKIKELVPYILIVIGVVLMRTYIITPIKVNGTSMYDTLKGNEICILNKLGELDRFDIIVTSYEGERLIKRIIGMPGETIEVENGYIYISLCWLNKDSKQDVWIEGGHHSIKINYAKLSNGNIKLYKEES